MRAQESVLCWEIFDEQCNPMSIEHHSHPSQGTATDPRGAAFRRPQLYSPLRCVSGAGVHGAEHPVLQYRRRERHISLGRRPEVLRPHHSTRRLSITAGTCVRACMCACVCEVVLMFAHNGGTKFSCSGVLTNVWRCHKFLQQSLVAKLTMYEYGKSDAKRWQCALYRISRSDTFFVHLQATNSYLRDQWMHSVKWKVSRSLFILINARGLQSVNINCRNAIGRK